MTNNDNEIVRVSCAAENCGTFPMDKALHRRLRKSGDTFSCPAGHRQHFNTDEQDERAKLRQKIGRLEKEIDYLEQHLDHYQTETESLYDKWKDEKSIRKELENQLLRGVNGAAELGDGRWKWACECGGKTTTTFDTEREAWEAYDKHRDRTHDESEAAYA